MFTNSSRNLVTLIKFGVKCFIANLLALVAVSFVIYFYQFSERISPWDVDSFPFQHGKPGATSCFGTEGFSYGILDSNGLNNQYCVEHNLHISTPQANRQTDVASSILLGSSHMEAAQVPVNKNCCYLINKRFENDDHFLLYNMGCSERYLDVSVNMYQDVLEYFQPDDFVIFETFFLPNPEKVKTALEPVIKKTPVKFPFKKYIKYFLYYLPSVRYLKGHINTAYGRKNSPDSIQETSWNEENVVYLQEFLKRISEPSKAYGVQPILFFHPHFTLHEDGTATLDFNSEDLELYRSICEEQGIIFLYLGDRFMREYEQNNIVPYGFWNSLPNWGHLNKDGHRMVAEELCKVLEQLEKTKKENVQ